MKLIIIPLLLASSIILAHENEESHKFECDGKENREGVVARSYFSQEEKKIVQSIRQTETPLIFEEFNQKSLFIDQEHAIRIEWDQAKKIILMGYAKSVLQSSHAEPHAYILGGSGHTYIVTPPKNETVYTLASIIDPCSVYISRSQY